MALIQLYVELEPIQSVYYDGIASAKVSKLRLTRPKKAPNPENRWLLVSVDIEEQALFDEEQEVDWLGVVMPRVDAEWGGE